MVSVGGRVGRVEGLRLVALVGRGGEGEVWDARDAFGRRRACKLIHPDFLAAPDEVRRRGRWLTRIEHPALVRVHRSAVLRRPAELAGWGLVEMDFVDGADLADHPADPGILQRLLPVAEALDLLHAGCWSRGVPLVHRDVKPANLVARPDGSLVLVDVSTLRGADATHLTRIGTPVFAAPEVASGRIGPAADVYSFAATVVALVTGLRGSALAQLLTAPQQLDLPPGIGRALAPHPGDRPASCRALLDADETIVVPWRTAEERAGRSRTATTTLQVLAAPVAPTRVLDVGAVRAPALDAGRQRVAEPGLHPGRDGAAEPRWGAERRGGLDALPDARPARRAVLPWLALAFLAAALPFAPVVQAALPIRSPTSVAAGAEAAVAAAGLHLVAVTLARGSPGLALVLPPLAWAALLGDRIALRPRRRLWACSLLLPGLTAVAAAPLGLLAGIAAPRHLLAVGGAGAAATLAAVAAARRRGVPAALLRLLLAPMWLLGAGVIVALCLVALLPALVVGRAGALLRVIARAAAGIVEFATAGGP